MDRYPANYTDAGGCAPTSIANDGSGLRLHLRGLEFVGRDFDSLEPPKDASPDALLSFSLNRGCLCSCRLEWRMPVAVDNCGNQIDGVLLAELTLGDPAANGGLSHERLRIILEAEGKRITSPGTSGWFEDELLAIQAQLPEGVSMRACINCRYSGYGPSGHGLFGCLACYRNRKAEYLAVKTKKDFLALGPPDQTVQETYLCPEFERRMHSKVNPE